MLGVKMSRPALANESVLFQDIPSVHYKGVSYGGMLSDLLPANDNYGTDGETLPMSFGFKYSCAEKNMNRLMAFEDRPHIVGDYAIFTTSQNKFAVSLGNYEKYGPVFNVDDLKIDEWMNVTRINQSKSYGPNQKFVGISIARHSTEIDFPRKRITQGSYSGHFGEYGMRLSQAYNAKTNAIRFENSKEGRALIAKYGNGKTISKFGVDREKDVVYSIDRLSHGDIKLYFGQNSSNEIAKLAEHYKVHVNDMTNAILGEEYMHLFRNSFDKVGSVKARIKEELATKQDLLEFYQSMMEGARNSAERKKYFRLAQHVKRDIETTPERYSKAYSSKRANLESKLEAEAEYLGLTEKEAMNYVASRLKESGSDNESSRLEEIVDSDSESSEKTTKAANENYHASNDNGSEDESSANKDSNSNYKTTDADDESSGAESEGEGCSHESAESKAA